MRKVLHIILAIFVSVGVANAAVRSTNSTTRASQKNTSARQQTQNTTARATSTNITRTNTSSQKIATRAAKTTARQSAAIARAVSPGAVTRSATVAKSTPQRTATPTNTTVRTARATVSTSGIVTPGYNVCRDAYFTCMDQFCGTANDQYRRCICSSKLSEVQSREKALSQAADQIQNFKDLNISVIDKSSAEVGAMLSASDGELAQSKAQDNSASASKLAGISAVLADTKNKSLSTAGTLDIAGDIRQIWSTTDLAGGTNISNLTGESLYNAVHAQCAQMVSTQCPSDTILDMATSAYGMYIENDCSLLINNLDKQLTNANTTIRDTEHEMQLARLENYNTHNATVINDCVAQVRADLTGNAACGPDYVHCLDVTGLYLTYTTGEPIYSPNFYQLENQTSLTGDVLTNQTNRMLVAKLNNMRDFASRGLDTCRDLADTVWDEFMRQAIAEIHQGQQERIRQVKNECLDVVNTCYDTQSQQLKDFSNTDEKLVLGARLELAEEICREKLDACSNLYGGGTNGLNELIIAMSDITEQKIAQQCADALRDFVKKQCAVPGNDTLHSYPYGCRTYAPGDAKYMFNSACNRATPATKDLIHIDTPSDDPYQCGINKKYTSCNQGYVMTYNGYVDLIPKPGNKCLKCPPDKFECEGGTNPPKPKTTSDSTDDTKCPKDAAEYIGSMYHMLARYAADVCMRPSAENKYALSQSILQDISTVMTEIRSDMITELAKECERLDGNWSSIPPQESIDQESIDNKFYTETATSEKWGYCDIPNNQDTPIEGTE